MAVFEHCSVLARLYVIVKRLAVLNDENMALKAGPLPEDNDDTPLDATPLDTTPSAPKKVQ